MERVVLKYNCFIVSVESEVRVRLQPEAELWAYLACVRKMREEHNHPVRSLLRRNSLDYQKNIYYKYLSLETSVVYLTFIKCWFETACK